MEKIISNCGVDNTRLISAEVFVGSVFKDLVKGATIDKGTIAVMGTHKTSGANKLFKSKALKVLSKADIPFILTQGTPSKSKIKTIVMPFGFAKESIQVARFAADLAKKFEATIHLVGYKSSDVWLQKNTNVNQMIVKKYLTAFGVDYKTKLLKIKKSTYEKELLKYVDDVNADLIAATYFYGGLNDIYNPFLHQLVSNSKKIPVFTINAQNLSSSSNYSFLSV